MNNETMNNDRRKVAKLAKPRWSLKNLSGADWMVIATFSWLMVSIAYLLIGWLWRSDTIVYWLVIAANQSVGFFAFGQLFVVPIAGVMIVMYFVAQLTRKRLDLHSLLAITFLLIAAIIPFVIVIGVAIDSGGGTYQHVSSASLGSHRYYLADVGHVYALFECDQVGLICHRIDQTYAGDFGDTLVTSPEEGRLYVERDGIIVYEYPGQSTPSP